LQKFHTAYCEATTDNYESNRLITSITAVKAAITCKLLYCDRYLAGSRSSWSGLVIALFTLTTANGRVGYHASRMASLRDPFLHPFSSTSTPLTCQTVSRKNAYANDLAIMHADGEW